MVFMNVFSIFAVIKENCYCRLNQYIFLSSFNTLCC